MTAGNETKFNYADSVSQAVLIPRLSEVFFWGLAPRPPLGDEARPPDPLRSGLRIGGMTRFASVGGKYWMALLVSLWIISK